jgi:hypothetical protein
MRNACKILVENLKVGGHSRVLGVNVKIMDLKEIWLEVVWIGLIWLREGTGGRVL